MPPHFYIDESGDFDVPQDPVSAGGLLLLEPGFNVRESLERALPGFPWPLHAAHVNQPVSWVLALAAEVPDNHPLDAPYQDVLLTLRHLFGERLQAAVEMMRGGLWPEYDTLVEFAAALRQHNAAMLQHLSRLITQARAYARRAGARLPGLAVIASEAGLNFGGGAVAPRRTGHEATDRYYALLGGAIERARAIAVQRKESILEVTVLSRGVYSPEHGRMLELTQQNVLDVVNDLPPSPCTVELHPIALWTPDVPPPCVVADVCTNTGRWLLGDAFQGLTSLETALTRHLALPIRSGEPPRSHLAAAFPPGPGPWVDAHHGSENAAPVGIRQWAWDLARETTGGQP